MFPAGVYPAGVFPPGVFPGSGTGGAPVPPVEPATPLETVAEIEERIRWTGGVPVAYGALTTWGHRDDVDEEIQEREGGGVITAQQIVTVATGPLGTIASGGVITCDGVTFEIREVYRVGDGKLTTIELGKL